LFGEVKDVNDTDYVFEERGKELVLVDFPSRIPETCSVKAIAAGFNWGPELSSRKLNADSAFWKVLEIIVAKSVADVGFACARITNNDDL